MKKFGKTFVGTTTEFNAIDLTTATGVYPGTLFVDETTGAVYVCNYVTAGTKEWVRIDNDAVYGA